ncbi:unnamed protein product [Closterium sp. NIES-65]|nr:unnamed protein product [Closterium sp. NIES-65]
MRCGRMRLRGFGRERGKRRREWSLWVVPWRKCVRGRRGRGRGVMMEVRRLGNKQGGVGKEKAEGKGRRGRRWEGDEAGGEEMIEVVLNDRLGKKIRVKCNEDDTIGDLKKLVAAQTGTRPEKIRIQKWYNIYKDHITLADYEIHDGMGLELYYN